MKISRIVSAAALSLVLLAFTSFLPTTVALAGPPTTSNRVGAPGPVVGAGAPALVAGIGYGIYWLRKRRRQRNLG